MRQEVTHRGCFPKEVRVNRRIFDEIQNSDQRLQQLPKLRYSDSVFNNSTEWAHRAAPGSLYSLALAVKTAVDKYAHQLPLARQVVIAAECGFEVTTQTLWDLVYRIGSLLSPTAQELLIRLLQRDVIGLDQTSWPRLDVAGQKPWQMWALTAGGPISGQQGSLPAIAVHRICDDKGAATFLDLVGPYSGVIVCDAATAHGSGARDAPGTIILAGCWARIWSERANARSGDVACVASKRLLRIIQLPLMPAT
jgi:transposase